LLGNGIEIPDPQRDLNLRSRFGDAAKSGATAHASDPIRIAAQRDREES
jgi:hypothetical protein